jgi:FdhD protein
VTLAPGVVPDLDRTARSGYQISACGVCGKTSIDAIATKSRDAVANDPVRLSPDVVAGLPDALRAQQKVFDRTGGLHAAGLFTAGGDLLAVREDVGRHNALDKLMGALARTSGSSSFANGFLAITSRASWEMVHKAAHAGIAVIAAISAPTSLAIEAADGAGITLIAFARDESMNIYSRAARIA